MAREGLRDEPFAWFHGILTDSLEKVWGQRSAPILYLDIRKVNSCYEFTMSNLISVSMTSFPPGLM